jgi:hypothetical protein
MRRAAGPGTSPAYPRRRLSRTPRSNTAHRRRCIMHRVARLGAGFMRSVRFLRRRSNIRTRTTHTRTMSPPFQLIARNGRFQRRVHTRCTDRAQSGHRDRREAKRECMPIVPASRIRNTRPSVHVVPGQVQPSPVRAPKCNRPSQSYGDLMTVKTRVKAKAKACLGEDESGWGDSL